MPALDARHDYSHPVEGDQAWSESYYFNCYDPVTDTGLFTRIGIRPNEGTMDVGLTVWLPGTRIARRRVVRDCTEMIDTDLEVGGLRYQMIEPLREWHLSGGGDALVTDLDSEAPGGIATLGIDLRFEALAPAVGADGQGSTGAGASARARDVVGKGHLEQPGRWTGSISADGVTYGMGDARGNRDKSWGPRRWSGPRMWRWFSINFGGDEFGEGVHLGGIRIGTDDGDLHRGWVYEDGRFRSIRQWDIRTELEEDGVTHRALDVVVTDKDGEAYELHGEVLRVEPGRRRDPSQPTVVNEGLTRWTYRDLTGYGIAEYLHQFDRTGTPIVAIE
ncbi:MAG: hypothetical protein JJLCMIEE_02432 [Acidimicrobiales bacterium]|nr:MAG: hypothetical protein EDR02_12920 [Actinomycetota bacterium]MBV6509363.1 hypothetical protein [Acidimicrobiales bacterium]RIK04602.1 MAG: hypothetical protein DCC48_12900 [Acidobacteriota bacterium]